MVLRDGVRLDADIYRPNGDGPFPVLLMRQPYGRRIASTVCYAHPAWYAAQGFIVVIQDTRGQGTSGGDFRLFESEGDDGHDTVEWAARLPGANGAVGMYGFSYQGVTQLLAAATLPPSLKAIAPAMIGWDLRRDWSYENGAFAQAANISWAVQLAALAARRAGDTAAFAELTEAARGHLLGSEISARPAVLDRHAKFAMHYGKWLDPAPADAYWASISPASRAEELTGHGPPALFVGGWYDTHLPGTISGFRAYQRAGRTECRLIVGPWSHFPWGRHLAGCDFGDLAVQSIDQLQVRWFNQHLRGGDALPDKDRVRLFDTGAKCWRNFEHWPDCRESWSLESAGRASLDPLDGTLIRKRDVDGRGLADRLVHDPWRPVPSVGGAFGQPVGPADRTEVESRTDVLTYTTVPFTAPLSLAGIPSVRLAVTSDRPSFDISCILSVVNSSGQSRFLTEGYAHVPANPDGELRLELRPLCVTLGKDERLRLSVAGASFPAFPVNPGSGQNPVNARVDECEVITVILEAGASAIELPLAMDA